LICWLYRYVVMPLHRTVLVYVPPAGPPVTPVPIPVPNPAPRLPTCGIPVTVTFDTFAVTHVPVYLPLPDWITAHAQVPAVTPDAGLHAVGLPLDSSSAVDPVWVPRLLRLDPVICPHPTLPDPFTARLRSHLRLIVPVCPVPTFVALRCPFTHARVLRFTHHTCRSGSHSHTRTHSTTHPPTVLNGSRMVPARFAAVTHHIAVTPHALVPTAHLPRFVRRFPFWRIPTPRCTRSHWFRFLYTRLHGCLAARYYGLRLHTAWFLVWTCTYYVHGSSRLRFSSGWVTHHNPGFLDLPHTFGRTLYPPHHPGYGYGYTVYVAVTRTFTAAHTFTRGLTPTSTLRFTHTPVVAHSVVVLVNLLGLVLVPNARSPPCATHLVGSITHRSGLVKFALPLHILLVVPSDRCTVADPLCSCG